MPQHVLCTGTSSSVSFLDVTSEWGMGDVVVTDFALSKPILLFGVGNTVGVGLE